MAAEPVHTDSQEEGLSVNKEDKKRKEKEGYSFGYIALALGFCKGLGIPGKGEFQTGNLTGSRLPKLICDETAILAISLRTSSKSFTEISLPLVVFASVGDQSFGFCVVRKQDSA